MQAALSLLLLPLACRAATCRLPPDPACIAAQFGVSQAEVTALLDRLEAAGRAEVWARAVLAPAPALLVIDMQEDFINGSLAVNGSAAILEPIRRLAAGEGLAEGEAGEAGEAWHAVVYSQDWHPGNHISFFSNLDQRELDPEWRASHPGEITLFQEVVFARSPPYHQVLWPDHCRQDSQGAKLHPDLLPLPPGAQLVMKGTNPEVDSYSAFFDNTGVPGAGGTGLQEMLAGSTELVVVGLATDYCVGSSALHGLELGLPTTLLADLARPVNEASGAAMEARVAAAGGWVEGEAAWRAGRGSWARATRLADFWLGHGSARLRSAAPGLAGPSGALVMALLGRWTIVC